MKTIKIALAALMTLSLIERTAAADKGSCYKGSTEIEATKKRTCKGIALKGTFTHEQCKQEITGRCWVKKGEKLTAGVDAQVGECYPTYDKWPGTQECQGTSKGIMTKRQCYCGLTQGKCIKYIYENPVVHLHLTREPSGRRLQDDGETCDVFFGGEPHLKTWSGEWYDYMGELESRGYTVFSQ